MSHSRILNHFNGLHERALRLVYSDFSSNVSELLIKDKYATIHQGNLPKVAVEMLKVKNNLAPKIMKNVFSFKTLPCNLRKSTSLKCRSTETVLYVSGTISSLEPKRWLILPLAMVRIKFSGKFKKKL